MTRRDLFKFIPPGLGSLLFCGGDCTDTSVEEAIKLVVRQKPPAENKELTFELNGLKYNVFTTANFLLTGDINGEPFTELNVYGDYLKICAVVSKIEEEIAKSKVMRFECPHFHKMDLEKQWPLQIDNIIRKSQAVHLSQFGPITNIPPLTQITWYDEMGRQSTPLLLCSTSYSWLNGVGLPPSKRRMESFLSLPTHPRLGPRNRNIYQSSTTTNYY